MKDGNGKALRFAALVRVSGEKQEKKKESLKTQHKQIEQAATALGGVVTRWFEGQEHATEGYERQKFDALLAEAAKPNRAFDAVMVADTSRWSRDNIRSEEGLRLLRDNGVGFYLLTSPQNLFDPNIFQMLRQFAGFNAYFVAIQKQKSMLNRIEKAKRGIPCVRCRPFGRKWVWSDEYHTAGHWEVIPEDLAMIQDVAKRCLAGESMQKIAAEYDVNHPHLCKILRVFCGDSWSVSFQAKEFGIDVEVPMKIPRLLPEETIKAVTRRLQDNMKRLNGRPRHDYLLNGYIFCGACGFLMTGQQKSNGGFYRHATHPEARKCPLRDPRPWVQADVIEGQVVFDLFKLFGNPAEIERAIKAAIPDCEQELKKRQRLEEEVAKVNKQRERVVDSIADGTLTKEQAKKKLGELADREQGLRDELDGLNAVLADVPSEEALQLYVDRVGGSIVVYDQSGGFTRDDGTQYTGGNDIGTWMMMSRRDKRALIEAHFGSALPGGKAGVYILGPKPYRYELRGRLAWRASPSVIPIAHHWMSDTLHTDEADAKSSRLTKPSPPFLLVGEVA